VFLHKGDLSSQTAWNVVRHDCVTLVFSNVLITNHSFRCFYHPGTDGCELFEYARMSPSKTISLFPAVERRDWWLSGRERQHPPAALDQALGQCNTWVPRSEGLNGHGLTQKKKKEYNENKPEWQLTCDGPASHPGGGILVNWDKLCLMSCLSSGTVYAHPQLLPSWIHLW
jgi:hypothetical protein